MATKKIKYYDPYIRKDWVEVEYDDSSSKTVGDIFGRLRTISDKSFSDPEEPRRKAYNDDELFSDDLIEE